MSPVEAKVPENFRTVFNIMSPGSEDWKYRMNEPVKFNVGDKVRTKIMKGKFDKGTKPKFSNDIYTISEIGYDGVHYYILKKLPDKFFYEAELVRVR